MTKTSKGSKQKKKQFVYILISHHSENGDRIEGVFSNYAKGMAEWKKKALLRD